MRKYLRARAKTNMTEAGYTKINRERKGRGTSVFARRWKQFI